jgi:plasmid stabilization system protein ParE
MRTCCLFFLAVVSSLTASAQNSLDKLKTDAEKAHGGQQAKLYAQIAEKLVDVADQQFTAGKSVEGLATVQDVLQYATKAHDIALNAHDDRKQVEIVMRQTQRHLEAVKRTLAAEDRPELDQVEKKLEQFRQDLLDSMFAPKKKDNK